jgi:hypothetical protein
VAQEVEPLTEEERAQYEEAKVTICGYTSAYYVVVGRRLEEVLAHIWFRGEFISFNSFCLWAIGHGDIYGYRLINAAKVHACLQPIGSTLPHNECQARPLTVLLDRPELLIEVWQTALARSLDGKITGKFVAKGGRISAPREASRGGSRPGAHAS